MRSAFVIAAASSGSGKTTFSLGLMRALTSRGLNVQPFKCGPDYIDTQFHRAASGCDSINLDLFMSSAGHVRSLFGRYSAGADVSVVEGVMGMFDGYSDSKGSSADIAKTLDLPVILLVNAKSSAFSTGAIVYGFKNFDPDVKVAGVVFNCVASESHYHYLRNACAHAGVECFGYLRRMDSLSTPSRHLGLTLGALQDMSEFADRAAREVSQTVDVDALLAATTVDFPVDGFKDTKVKDQDLRIAVARDEAFNFIYKENIRQLELIGKVSYFSPLHDETFGEADLLYLPGGYPELFAAELSSNIRMRRVVKDYIEGGGRTLAECGGMIYLTQDMDGAQMCGVLPLSCTMNGAKLHLGYRELAVNGLTFRGHEFHYSTILGEYPSVAKQRNVRGNIVETPLYKYKNLYAGYTHLYWGEQCLLSLWKNYER